MKIIALCAVILILLCVDCYAVDEIEATYELPFVGSITADDVHMRAGNHTNFESLGKLSKEAKVLIVERSFNWYKIELPAAAACFVSKNFIEKQGIKGVVIADRLNVRARPAPESNIIGQLHKDEEALIVRELDEWYQIRPSGGCFAWVFADFVEFSAGSEDYYTEKQKRSAEFKATLDEAIAALSLSRIGGIPKTGREAPSEARGDEAISKQSAGEEDSPLAEGILEEVGRIFFKPGSHKITTEGKTVCFLKSETLNLDDYLDTKVRIWGEPLKSRSKYHPTFQVTKIEPVNEKDKR